MVFDVRALGEDYEEEKKRIGEGVDAEEVTVYKVPKEEGKAFLVVRKNTIEVRTDRKLSQLLQEKYESVMESRYFGRGGIEIVVSGQLDEKELADLVRLSYNMSD
ncbi:hypothetical protein IJG10_01715 [Candidatus Saccharibacteria bacterium]|nr:hypothetical protein [Candidatus Saccharibacteria bacterium]MBQ3306360.1 hypothetical protein [Candidatus Saccharibacteria bacterium]